VALYAVLLFTLSSIDSSLGLTIDLHAVNFQSAPRGKYQALASLPPYVWNHTKGFWHNSAWGKTYRYLRKPRTDLLGLRLQNQNRSEPRWQNFLRLSEQPWIADHRVQQMVLYPGAAMITMAVQAAYEMLDTTRVLRGIEARKIIFKRPLLMPSGDFAVESAIHLRPIGDESGDYSFRIFSQAEGEDWEENCSGLVSTHYSDSQEYADDCDWTSHASLYSVIRQRATRKLAPQTFYKFFDKKMNLQYGPLHQNVSECVAGVREGYGTITIPDTKASMPSQFEYPHLIHPTTLDSIFHLQALGYLHTLSGDESLVPVSIESVFLAADIPSTPGSLLAGYSKSIKMDTGDFIGDILLSDSNWRSPKAVVRGFLSRDISATNPKSIGSTLQRQKCTTFTWEEFIQIPNTGKEGQKTHDLGGPDTMMTKISRIGIICRQDTAPATLSLVEKLTKVLEELNYTVLVAYTSFPTSEEYSTLSESADQSEISQALLTQHQLLFEQETTIISLVELDQAFIAKWTGSDLDWFKNLTSHASKMLWVTRGGGYATEESLDFGITTGLLRTLRVEMPQLRLPHLDLSQQSDLTAESTIQSIVVALENSSLSESAIYEQEFAIREGKMLVPRLRLQESFHQELSSRPAPTTPSLVRLLDLGGVAEGIMEPGTNAIGWQYARTTDLLGKCDLEIAPSAVTLDPASINNTGFLGQDAVGTVLRVGSSVQGFAPGETVVICASHTLRTSIVVDQNLARHVPAFVDPSLIVTLPSALCTAQGALLDLGRLQPEETVLIAAKPGSTEQALIYLAKKVGAEVFIVAQDLKHEQILIESLGIDEEHVVTSPTTQDGSILGWPKGVDLFVTTFTGSLTWGATQVLSEFGRFVGIGTEASNITAASFPKNITLANFDLEHMRKTSPMIVAGLLKKAWDRASTHGLPQAVSTRSYPLPKVEAALCFLRSERCFSNVVLHLAPDDQVLIPPPSPAELKLDPSATYILAGGLGGIGRSIADMMFDEGGARNIIFLSRSGAGSEESRHFLNSLKIRGCNAQAFECDITDPEQVRLCVTQCENQGMKIRGVVQSAMVLRDSMFENMTFQQ